jgi:predicted glutamine amidotransferase
MCGIVGTVGSPSWGSYNLKYDLIKDLLIIDQIRGVDGTGIYMVDKKSGKVITQKSADHGTDFVNGAIYEGLLNNVDSQQFIVGHNRAATVGAINDESSHPFQAGTISMVHNGTIGLRGNGLKPYPDCKVDSDVFTHNMAYDGEVETLQNVIGAYAIVWYNTDNGMLRMARNSQRPLYVARIQDKDPFWVYASEEDMIKLAASHNKLRIRDSNIIPVSHIVSFDIEDISKMHIRKIPAKPSIFDFSRGKRGNNISRLPSPTTTTTTTKDTSSTGHLLEGFKGTEKSANEESLNEKEKRYRDTLTAMGLKFNQRVPIMPVAFHYYNKNLTYNPKNIKHGEWGYIEGVMLKYPWSTVIMNGIKSDSTTFFNDNEGKDYIIKGLLVGADSNYPALGYEVALMSNTNYSIDNPLKKKKDSEEKEPSEKEGDRRGFDVVKGPNGYITKSEFKSLVQYGCSNCSCDLDEIDAENQLIVWTHNNDPLCEQCGNSYLIDNYIPRHKQHIH